jgi:hypothetical protein
VGDDKSSKGVNMKEINCTTSNCEHNVKCKCLAGIIAIGDNAKCLSRIKRDGGALAQSFADVEAGEEFFGESTEVVVQCSAECALNHNGLCTAEKIDVDDVLLGTKCKTRIPIKEK